MAAKITPTRHPVKHALSNRGTAVFPRVGLTPADGAEIALRSDLNLKIAKVVAQKRLTHAQVARLARISRTRITAILNRKTKDISTDLLLRVLYALGYTARITFQRPA